ncbi:acetolactate synthase small subunit [Candidatus Bathyarchaeota archaeon]|nr:MAG: acetolactate synthase small subunit [Candidatus Hecatellales archaeon]RLI34228.1 MAG: acetolactate synthase small subunit [Candidatus Bathyarchaeota archaeon]
MAEGKAKDQIFAVIVENKPGVLFRVTNMIRRRGFNIESISVGTLVDPNYSRMTIVVRGEEPEVSQVMKNLYKLVETVRVAKIPSDNSVVRELALIKVEATSQTVRSDILNYANIFRAKVVDVVGDSLTIEITGEPRKIDAFIDVIKPFGIKEIARTGIAALVRGSQTIHDEEVLR